MTIQLATSTRNAQLAAWGTDTGASAKLLIYSGAMPANCAAAATGTLLATFTLAATWLGTPAAGAVALANLPLSATIAATASAGYFRVTKTDGTTCTSQGTITATGGGGDMTFDSIALVSGNTLNIASFSLTEGNP